MFNLHLKYFKKRKENEQNILPNNVLDLETIYILYGCQYEASYIQI